MDKKIQKANIIEPAFERRRNYTLSRDAKRALKLVQFLAIIAMSIVNWIGTYSLQTPIFSGKK